MNNFNNIFDNLLPLRPLIPFVQSVLPTVFDDSLSYLETLGKVVKALNDTETNVNTLEAALRAVADDLAEFENLTIYPVNMTFNENTGNYAADKTFADIDAALLEGRTPILHVVDRDGRNYYSAQLAKSGNTVFYWTTPLFYENGESVIFRAFINSSDVSGVIASPIDSGAVVVNYTTVSGSDIPVVDKTFEQISAALEDNKPVFLFVDSAYWIPLSRANRSGNDVDGYHYVSAEFIYAIPVSTTGGNNLGVGVYSVNTSDVWSVTRYAFPDTGKVNALIEARIASLDGFNSIKKLIYNELNGNVVYYDGATSTPMTGEEVQINFLSDPKIYVVLEGGVTTSGNTVYNLYVPFRYGFVDGANIGVQFYRVFNGNLEIVTLPANSSVATKTVDSALSSTSENPVQNKVVKTALDAKQDTLTAGQNVTIIGNTISADVDSSEIATIVTEDIRKVIKSVYQGKKLSILGDSISTFSGYIPEGNATYYPSGTVTHVTDTWWDKLREALGMELEINNSWSGSRVTTTAGTESAGCMARCQNLGNPDVIIVWMGINDFNAEVQLGTYNGETSLPVNTTTFREAYAIMLNKILTAYQTAEVWVCTLPQCERNGETGFPEINGNGVSLVEYNKAILELADAFGVKVLDHNKSGLTYQNMPTYNPDNLHPNKNGHSLIANNDIWQMDGAVAKRYA